MDIHQNLELFRELMLCDGSIYSWCYEANGNLLYSNCPDQIVLAPAFEIFGCLGKMLEIGKTRSNPAFLSSEMGLVWGVAFEKSEDVLYRCHVIGPVFSSAISVDTIFHTVMSKDLSAYSTAWVQRFREALYQVPTSQYTIFSRNLRLLHYCVTGKRIEISEIYADIVDLKSPRTDSLHRDRHSVYMAEKAMLRMVEQGDLNYKQALSGSMMLSDGVGVSTKDPMTSARVSAIVFSSIVCRAAMRGGISPDEAYSVGDAYIQSALDAGTLDEISTICISMYDDFIRRVHRHRNKQDYSSPIRRCCEYMEMNLDRSIRAAELASLVGYSVTYLTRRFKEETGMGIGDYARLCRIERAKLLLETSDMSIQDISDALGFSTRSYFSQCFREVTGMTPKGYQQKNT